jgi:hypothetical protein
MSLKEHLAPSVIASRLKYNLHQSGAIESGIYSVRTSKSLGEFVEAAQQITQHSGSQPLGRSITKSPGYFLTSSSFASARRKGSTLEATHSGYRGLRWNFMVPLDTGMVLNRMDTGG